MLGLSLCSGRCSGLWQLHNLHQWHKHMLSCQCLYVCKRRILAQVEQIDERIKYFTAYQNHSSEAWTYQRCCRAVVDQIRINIILVYIISMQVHCQLTHTVPAVKAAKGNSHMLMKPMYLNCINIPYATGSTLLHLIRPFCSGTLTSSCLVKVRMLRLTVYVLELAPNLMIDPSCNPRGALGRSHKPSTFVPCPT